MFRSRVIATLLACGTLTAAAEVASAADLTGALTFVGIPPCRIFDTRGGSFTGQAGGPIVAAATTRTFQITGTVPGVPTQCGIPRNAAAISINITVTGFTGAGDVRLFPAGSPVSSTSIINYQLENIANSTTVPLGPVAAEKGITVQADASATHILGDVNGYYVARPMTIVVSDGPGSTTATTPTTVASIYAADFTSQGHTTGRLIARWQNSQQAPACSGSNATVQLVQAANCGATTGGTVLASIGPRGCGSKAWLDFSPTFTLPSTSANGCLDIRVGVDAGTASWRAFELELIK